MVWIAGGATIFNALYRVHPKSITNGIYHQLNHTPWGFSTLYDLIFPLFVFTMAVGWSLLLLSLFYWVIDVKGCKRWAFFFVVIGANAITIYLAPFLIDIGTLEIEQYPEFFFFL